MEVLIIGEEIQDEEVIGMTIIGVIIITIITIIAIAVIIITISEVALVGIIDNIAISKNHNNTRRGALQLSVGTIQQHHKTGRGNVSSVEASAIHEGRVPDWLKRLHKKRGGGRRRMSMPPLII